MTTRGNPVPHPRVILRERRPARDPTRTRHSVSKVTQLKRGRTAAELDTPTDLDDKAVAEISKALNGILADAFALYLKTKNFHWHISGPHFRDYHLMLDEQADAIFATTDPLAERVRKLSGTTLRSISDISARQSLKDNNEQFVGPNDMMVDIACL